MRTVPIVMLASANNIDQEHLTELNEELHGIEGALRMKHDTDLLEVKSFHEMDFDYFSNSIKHYRNRLYIFHFSGHAGNSILLFTDGKAISKSIQTLMTSEEVLYASKLVFLNGCGTFEQAREIVDKKIADIAIGTSGKVGDSKAKAFALSFYESLGGDAANKGTSIKKAFEDAVASICQREDIAFTEDDIPIVAVRADFVDESCCRAEETGWFLIHNQSVELLEWKLPQDASEVPEKFDPKDSQLSHAAHQALNTLYHKLYEQRLALIKHNLESYAAICLGIIGDCEASAIWTYQSIIAYCEVSTICEIPLEFDDEVEDIIQKITAGIGQAEVPNYEQLIPLCIQYLKESKTLIFKAKLTVDFDAFKSFLQEFWQPLTIQLKQEGIAEARLLLCCLGYKPKVVKKTTDSPLFSELDILDEQKPMRIKEVAACDLTKEKILMWLFAIKSQQSNAIKNLCDESQSIFAESVSKGRQFDAFYEAISKSRNWLSVFQKVYNEFHLGYHAHTKFKY